MNTETRGREDMSVCRVLGSRHDTLRREGLISGQQLTRSTVYAQGWRNRARELRMRLELYSAHQIRMRPVRDGMFS
jgi:hypothetical protein